MNITCVKIILLVIKIEISATCLHSEIDMMNCNVFIKSLETINIFFVRQFSWSLFGKIDNVVYFLLYIYKSMINLINNIELSLSLPLSLSLSLSLTHIHTQRHTQMVNLYFSWLSLISISCFVRFSALDVYFSFIYFSLSIFSFSYFVLICISIWFSLFFSSYLLHRSVFENC